MLDSRLLLAAFVLAIAAPASAQELSPEVQADLERAKIEQDMRAAAKAVAEQRYADALKEFDKLHEQGVPFPPSASLAEAKAAVALKRWERAEQALQYIFDTADRDSQAYKDALALYLDVQDKKEADAKARSAAAEAARKQAALERQQAKEERLQQEAQAAEAARLAEEARLAALRIEREKQIAQTQKKLSPVIGGSNVSAALARGPNNTVRVFYSESNRTVLSEAVFNMTGDRLANRTHAENLQRLDWQRKVPIGNTWLGPAVSDPDGGAITSQMYRLKNKITNLVMIEKFDGNGNSVWYAGHYFHRNIGASPQTNVRVGALTITPRGEIIECGDKKYNTNPSYVIFLGRAKDDGNHGWQETLRGETDNPAWCLGITTFSDSSSVALANLDRAPILIWLKDGNVVSSKKISTPGVSSFFSDITALDNGSFAIAGKVGRNAVINFLTADGEQTGSVPVAGSGIEAQFDKILRDTDGSLVAAGWEIDEKNGTYVPLFARISRDARVQSSNSIKNLSGDWVVAGFVKSGEGYAALLKSKSSANSYRGEHRLLFLNSDLELAPEGGFDFSSNE